ncbi:hypothetical protein BD779DRAFT_1475260 [Infundibulicybe gibba]|nr:hypothetical protein BD779DRAFT_1475260 [Infundibulicybe gibba]
MQAGGYMDTSSANYSNALRGYTRTSAKSARTTGETPRAGDGFKGALCAGTDGWMGRARDRLGWGLECLSLAQSMRMAFEVVDSWRREDLAQILSFPRYTRSEPEEGAWKKRDDLGRVEAKAAEILLGCQVDLGHEIDRWVKIVEDDGKELQGEAV